jgi:hypothetical protein
MGFRNLHLFRYWFSGNSSLPGFPVQALEPVLVSWCLEYIGVQRFQKLQIVSSFLDRE